MRDIEESYRREGGGGGELKKRSEKLAEIGVHLRKQSGPQEELER